MKHLHLATAHAAQWHESAAQYHSIRIVCIVLLVLFIVGLIRTIVKGVAERNTRAANAVGATARTDEHIDEHYAA